MSDATKDHTPLAGKVALVTGGTRGIGGAISRKLAQWGCDLYLNYVERDAPAREITAELTGAGHVVELVKADVADAGEVATMFETIRDHHGRLDILVHNAASTVFGAIHETKPSHFSYVFDTNVKALLLLVQQARPLLKGRQGRLITLSNRPAVHHIKRTGVFGAAKAAIEALTRSLAVELAADQIVVNCVRPGNVATAVHDLRPDFVAALESEAAASPWGRVTTPEDVADTVALLCLDEARWICGQAIVVDGGWSLWR